MRNNELLLPTCRNVYAKKMQHLISRDKHGTVFFAKFEDTELPKRFYTIILPPG